MYHVLVVALLSILAIDRYFQWRCNLGTQNTLGSILTAEQKLQADFDKYKADVATGIAALLKGATILGPGQVVVNQADLDNVAALQTATDTDVTTADAALPGQEAPPPAGQ